MAVTTALPVPSGATSTHVPGTTTTHNQPTTTSFLAGQFFFHTICTKQNELEFENRKIWQREVADGRVDVILKLMVIERLFSLGNRRDRHSPNGSSSHQLLNVDITRLRNGCLLGRGGQGRAWQWSNEMQTRGSKRNFPNVRRTTHTSTYLCTRYAILLFEQTHCTAAGRGEERAQPLTFWKADVSHAVRRGKRESSSAQTKWCARTNKSNDKICTSTSWENSKLHTSKVKATTCSRARNYDEYSVRYLIR